MSLDKKLSFGIFFVIKDYENKYLFVKHNYGMKKWSLPGGGWERGELTSDAGIRETLEESGFVTRPKKFIGIFSLKKSDGVVILYEADTVSGEIRIDGAEISEAKFLSLDEIHELNQKRELYDAQYSAVLWSRLPLREDGLPHEGWLTVPPTTKP